MSDREVLIRGVARIGVRTVERENGRYFVTIRNRTYSSEHEVPIEAARRHYRHIRAVSRSVVGARKETDA